MCPIWAVDKYVAFFYFNAENCSLHAATDLQITFFVLLTGSGSFPNPNPTLSIIYLP